METTITLHPQEPYGAEQSCRDYYRVEEALRYLARCYPEQPALQQIAGELGMSEFHFQRLFSRWVGISPKRFLQFLTKEHAKRLLAESASVLEASLQTGLSGPGRLHDLLVTCEALTPGEQRWQAAGVRIAYGVHPSPFGRCLLAVTERGICGLHFLPEKGGEEGSSAERWLRRRWPQAELVRDAGRTGAVAARVFAAATGRPGGPLHVYVRGTNFQIQVWQALLRIPPGRVVSYEELAGRVGRPAAARALGNAVGQNPVPFLIPCHRVIRKLGEFGNYGEGPERKKAILGWEAAQRAGGG
jgi:AraC family transcriptional regulator of adaptative response/methylated-DNA-[protein]-cysteine methyltransferase